MKITYKKIRIYLYIAKYQISDFKCKLYNQGIKLWWNKLWIRKDEFHSSLDMDSQAMMGMSKSKRSKYLEGLVRRRSIAHEQSL
jgi:hypothetical protein